MRLCFFIFLLPKKIDTKKVFWGDWKNPAKLYDDALVWSAVFIDWLDLFELIYELIGLTLFIWFFDKMDLVHLIDWLNEWMNPIHHIWRCMPNILYLMVANFMRYCTRIKISLGCWFHEILHQNQNISWLQISWDITPGSKYQWLQILWYITTGPVYLFVCLSFGLLVC